MPCGLRLTVAGSASGATHFRGHHAFTSVTARRLAPIPRMGLSMGFRSFGFPPACHPATGPPMVTPPGLTPAGHTSLFWTHNGAGGSPALRSPVRFTPRVMRPSGTAALSAATSPPTPPDPLGSAFPWAYSPVSGLADHGCFSQGTPASRVDQGVTSSRAPSLHGRYPASSLSGRRRRARLPSRWPPSAAQ